MNYIKKLLTKVGLAVGIISLVVGGAFFFLLRQTRETVSAVSIDEAKSIAVKNSGVRFSDAKFIRVEKDRSDGREVYDVEFYTPEGDFDYVIDAATGKVIERENNSYETTQSSPKTTVTVSQNTETTQVVSTPQSTQAPATAPVNASNTISGATPVQQAAAISQDEAVNRALADAGLNRGSVSGLYAYMDYDDGYTQYEVEFHNPSAYVDYDYTIDATTGQIIERSHDSSWDD